MFQDDYGIINSLLHVSIPWLSDDTLVKVAMIIKNIWGGLGTQVILFMAGMQNISDEYYEAAPSVRGGASHLPELTEPLDNGSSLPTISSPEGP